MTSITFSARSLSRLERPLKVGKVWLYRGLTVGPHKLRILSVLHLRTFAIGDAASRSIRAINVYLAFFVSYGMVTSEQRYSMDDSCVSDTFAAEDLRWNPLPVCD